MRRYSAVISFAVLAVVSAGCTRAVPLPRADIESVKPGDRVRLQERDGTFAEGRVAARDGESLQIAMAGRVEPSTVDLARIGWLQRRSGVKGHQGDGAFFGLLAGLGTAAGFIIGLNIHTDRWESVTSERYGIAVTPGRERAGVFWNF